MRIEIDLQRAIGGSASTIKTNEYPEVEDFQMLSIQKLAAAATEISKIYRGIGLLPTIAGIFLLSASFAAVIDAQTAPACGNSSVYSQVTCGNPDCVAPYYWIAGTPSLKTQSYVIQCVGGGCSGGQTKTIYSLVGTCPNVAEAWPGLRSILNRSNVLIAACDGSLLPMEDQAELFGTSHDWSANRMSTEGQKHFFTLSGEPADHAGKVLQ